jgi:hypothetical protein
MARKIIGIKKFKSRVTLDTLYGRVADYGMVENTMTLVENDNQLSIEWEVGDDVDYTEIGLVRVGKKITEYDGVMDLPKQAGQLLRHFGFNTKEIE